MKIVLSRGDKLFLAFSLVYAVMNFQLAVNSSFGADEGTHATVAMFYRDVFLNFFKFQSFQDLWGFGQEYMAHYPKLQVTYPPLWHIMTATAFYSIFGVSALAAKISTLFFSLLSMYLMYILVKRLFDWKASLLATMLFYLNAMSVFFSHRALIDFSAYVFIFAALIVFMKAMKTGGWKYYALTGILSFLAVMGQRPGILLFPFLVIYLATEKKWKNIIPLAVSFIIPFGVYALFIISIGGLEINYNVVQQAGETTGEPPVTSLESWVWYFLRFFELTGPASPVIIISFAFFIFTKKTNWKILLIWFIVMWIGLSIPQNKEARFYLLMLLPAFISFGYYISAWLAKYRLKIIIPVAALLVLYAYSSYIFISSETKIYPVEDAVDYAIKNGNGNIGMLTESGTVYSSSFIFRKAQFDTSKTMFFFRPCFFWNKSMSEIESLARNNSMEWLVVIREGDPVLIYEESLNNVPNSFVMEKKFGIIELYRIKDFQRGENIPCNRVCLTGQVICPTKKSPFDLLD